MDLGSGRTCAVTSLVGTSLRARGAGAGGAAAARPLQGRVHRDVRPPQVRVAVGTQTQQHIVHRRKRFESRRVLLHYFARVGTYLARMR